MKWPKKIIFLNFCIWGVKYKAWKFFPPTAVKYAFLRLGVLRLKTKNAIFEVKNYLYPAKMFWGLFQGFFSSQKNYGVIWRTVCIYLFFVLIKWNHKTKKFLTFPIIFLSILIYFNKMAKISWKTFSKSLVWANIVLFTGLVLFFYS